MRFVMPTGLFKKAIPICVGVIILSVSICTFISVRETRKSADKIEQAINETKEENAPVVNNNITVQGDYNNNTITDSYNHDNNNTTNNNTTTNNSTTNTTDNSTSDTDVYNDNRTEDKEENDTEDIIEDNTINNDTNSRYSENNNDDDYWQVPAVEHKTVLNKNLECPNCGAYTYSERYNPDLLEYYFGVCSTCHSENSNPDIVKR